MDKKPETLLTVVVIGRNEGERLVQCLSSVKEMLFSKGAWELIYVDSASQDDSVEQAAMLGAHTLALHPSHPTAALARNAGWKVAQGKFILFLDGDTILHPRFVEDSLGEFDNPKIAVVYGHRREMFPEQSIYHRVVDLDWSSSLGITETCGGDILVRREALDEVGGYDNSLIAGEEPELCRRLRGKGYQVLHLDQPMVLHDIQMRRFSQYWNRAFRTGYAYAEVSRRFWNTADPLWIRESQKVLWKGTVLVFAFGGGGVLSITYSSLQPILLMLAFFFSLALRSAWKARKRSNSVWTCLCYGIHSHLQYFPMWWGQIMEWWDRRHRKKRVLVEYKIRK